MHNIQAIKITLFLIVTPFSQSQYHIANSHLGIECRAQRLFHVDCRVASSDALVYSIAIRILNIQARALQLRRETLMIVPEIKGVFYSRQGQGQLPV